MAARSKPIEPWKMVVAGVVGAVVVVSCIVSLFTAPVWSAEWFAALAGVGVFGPVLALAITMLRPQRKGLKKQRSNMGLVSAILLFAGLSLALASAAVSGWIAYKVDGVPSFRTGTGSVRYDLPVPVFSVVMGVCSLAFGFAAAVGVRDLLRRRSGGARPKKHPKHRSN
ncbi:hypothetical protein GCM10028820_02190 [Tessaracoccus terricola]